MPIDPGLDREITALRKKTGAIADHLDQVEATLAAQRAELKRARSNTSDYRARSRDLLNRTDAEVREIIRFMKDFDRAAEVESHTRDSWRQLEALAKEQEALANQLSAICDELCIERDRLASSLRISSTALATAFERARVAPLLPATSTPNEQATAAHLKSLQPEQIAPQVPFAPNAAGDRRHAPLHAPPMRTDMPNRVPIATAHRPSDATTASKQRRATSKGTKSHGVSFARRAIVITVCVTLLFIIAALVASVS